MSYPKVLNGKHVKTLEQGTKQRSRERYGKDLTRRGHAPRRASGVHAVRTSHVARRVALDPYRRCDEPLDHFSKTRSVNGDALPASSQPRAQKRHGPFAVGSVSQNERGTK